MDEKNKNELIDKMENREKDKKDRRRILVLILGLLTVMVALIGATFAFYPKAVKTDGEKQSVTMEATVLKGVTYQSSDTLTLMNAIPGRSASTKITITNPNENAKVRYTLKVVTDMNDFVNTQGDGQLLVGLYTLDGTPIKIIDETDSANVKDEILISNVELDPRKSDDYEVRIEFKELDINQSSNQNKSFIGHIEIAQSIVVEQ